MPKEQGTLVNLGIMIIGAIASAVLSRNQSRKSLADREKNLHNQKSLLKLHAKASCTTLYRIQDTFHDFWNSTQEASQIPRPELQPIKSYQFEIYEKTAQEISAQSYTWVTRIQDSLNSWADIAPEELNQVHREIKGKDRI